MNMVAFNLNGEVKVLPYNFNSILKPIQGKMVICVTKDVNSIPLEFVDSDDCNIVMDDDMEMLTDRINVVPIYLLKGIEADSVYILPHDFSDSEKYVAYTRALSNLIIFEN